MDLLPGYMISVDQYTRVVTGCIYSSRGGSQEKEMFHSGMVFTDHTSRHVSTGNQVKLSYGEYLKSNMKYDRDTTNCGVAVQAYHT